MTSVKVTWIAGNPAPRASCKGLVKSVQTYCGLEIDIIAITPSTSCIHRVDATDPCRSSTTVVVIFAPQKKSKESRNEQPTPRQGLPGGDYDQPPMPCKADRTPSRPIKQQILRE